MAWGRVGNKYNSARTIYTSLDVHSSLNQFQHILLIFLVVWWILIMLPSCNLPLWCLFVSLFFWSSNAVNLANNSFPNNFSEKISHNSTSSTHNTLIQTPTSTLLLHTFLPPNISFSSLLNATSSVDVKAIHTLGVWKNRTVGSNGTFTASTSQGSHFISNSTDGMPMLQTL